MAAKLADMIEKNIELKRKGKIICQDGELEFDDPAIEDGFADLKAAVMTGRTDIVRILLSAAQTYRDEEEMFENEEDPNENGREKPDEQEVLDLLQMLLNFRDNDAGTALHYATKLEQTDIVRSLLDAGANPTLKNLENATPYDYCSSDAMKTAYVGALMQAVAQSKGYRVSLLLHAGVDVNSGDGADSDNKILHWAVSFADAEIVRLLIDSGANVNAVNGDGASALHDAVVRGDEEIIVELLNSGAKLNIIPFRGPLEGKNCYELAKGKDNILSIFQEFLKPLRIESESDSENGIMEKTNSDGNKERSATTPLSPSATLSPVLVPLNTMEDKKQDSSNEKHFLLNNTTEYLGSNFQPMLLPPKSPAKLFLPTLNNLDPAVAQLWPRPKNIQQYKGTYYVPPLNLMFLLMSSKNFSLDWLVDLTRIMEIMIPKFKMSGINIEYDLVPIYSTFSCCAKSSVECFIDPTSFGHDEEYRLQISTKKVKIVSKSIRSFFYAINTFLQCVRIFQGKGLPLLQISDWPEMSIRGVQLDFHQGDLPSLKYLLKIFDDLSGFKVNQIHLPVELFLSDDQNKYSNFTRSDLLHIHKFCKDRFMEIVPVFRSSDILGNVNTLSYASIKSDILPLFPSCRFLNVSSTENTSKTKHDESLLTRVTDDDLVRNVTTLHEFCVSNGLTLMVDSAFILQQPIKFLDLNHNLICLSLSKADSEENSCGLLFDLGISQVESPLYQDKDTIVDDIRAGVKVYQRRQDLSRSNNALGMIIRYESKPCNVCSFSIDFACLAVGAAMSWRSSNDLISDQSLLPTLLNRHVFLDDNDVIGDLLINLGSVEQIELIGQRNQESKSSTHENEHVEEKTQKRGLLKTILLSTDDLNSQLLNLESLKTSAVTLKQLLSSTEKSKTNCEAASMVMEEVTFLIKIMLFLCRAGLTLQKSFETNKEMKIGALTQIQRSDLSNKLMSLTEQYKTFCNQHYKREQNELKSLNLLQRLLTNFYPDTEPSFFNSLSRAFNI